MPKSKKPFTITPYRDIDKRIEVNGPDGFRFWVDADDVPHKVAIGGLKKMVGILNRCWRDDEELTKTQNWLRRAQKNEHDPEIR